MLTSLQVKDFKRLDDVEIELGKTVVFIGPNNSGKTTALQALALWEIGLRKWLEKRSAKDIPEKRPGITINRRDLIGPRAGCQSVVAGSSHTRSPKASRRQTGHSAYPDRHPGIRRYR